MAAAEHFGQLADVRCVAVDEHLRDQPSVVEGPSSRDARTGIGMKIEITVESLDPPLGWITCLADDGREPGVGERGVEFVGWLGLLRVLDELIGAPGHPHGPP